MKIRDTIVGMIKKAGSKKAFLENLLDEFRDHFITEEDWNYIRGLIGNINKIEKLAPRGFPIEESPVLQKIIEHVNYNLNRQEIEYEILGAFCNAEKVKNIISRCKTQTDLSRYMHDKDYTHLDAIASHLSEGENLSARQVVEMERIFTKAKERKANESKGVIYFDPSGFSKGSNHHSLYMATIYLINFGLSRGFGARLGKGRTSLNNVSGEDVLRFRKRYYDPKEGLAGFTEDFRQHKQIKIRHVSSRPFERYVQAIKKLEQYLAKINPERDIVKGLEYAVPKDVKMPYPNAFLRVGHEYKNFKL